MCADTERRRAGVGRGIGIAALALAGALLAADGAQAQATGGGAGGKGGPVGGQQAATIDLPLIGEVELPSFLSFLGSPGGASVGGGAPGQGPGAGGPPPAVVVTRAEVKPVGERLEFIGRIAPIQQVTIRTRVDGYIEKVAFSGGETVHRGDLLFQIQTDQYQVRARRGEGAADRGRGAGCAGAAQPAAQQAAEPDRHGLAVAARRGAGGLRSGAGLAAAGGGGGPAGPAQPQLHAHRRADRRQDLRPARHRRQLCQHVERRPRPAHPDGPDLGRLPDRREPARHLAAAGRRRVRSGSGGQGTGSGGGTSATVPRMRHRRGRGMRRVRPSLARAAAAATGQPPAARARPRPARPALHPARGVPPPAAVRPPGRRRARPPTSSSRCSCRTARATSPRAPSPSSTTP